MILGMGSDNEDRYNVTSAPISWAHPQNDPSRRVIEMPFDLNYHFDTICDQSC